jgi:6-phosphogluconate dehydrogenase
MSSSATSTSLPAPTLVGLGRMGANMARRMARGGLQVNGFDPSEAARAALAEEPRIALHASLQAAVHAQPEAVPRIVWLMLPAGAITEQTLTALEGLLRPGDVLVDGGNANYLDSQARGRHWLARGVDFVDCGVSGGIWGLTEGFCLMAGGTGAAIAALQPLFTRLAPAADRGWLHAGPSGAGHFSKMVHNGLEYGMMQSLAEGFALMQAREDLTIDLGAMAELWRHGSVVRSWLLDLTATALKNPADLDALAPVVADSGEGRWTVDEAVRQGTPVPVISAALMARFSSQGHADVTNKMLALMRKGFGGHATVAAHKD